MNIGKGEFYFPHQKVGGQPFSVSARHGLAAVPADCWRQRQTPTSRRGASGNTGSRSLLCIGATRQTVLQAIFPPCRAQRRTDGQSPKIPAIPLFVQGHAGLGLLFFLHAARTPPGEADNSTGQASDPEHRPTRSTETT